MKPSSTPLGALLVAGTVALTGCKKPPPAPPPPDPNALASCSIEGASAAKGQLTLSRISMTTSAFKLLKPTGKLTIDVVHETSSVGGTRTRVCGGATTLELTSYDAKGAATAALALDGACPPPAEGLTLRVTGEFLETGRTAPVNCSVLADIPRELGGGGLSPAELRSRADWQKLARESPGLVAPFKAYAAPLPKVVASLGDPRTARKQTACPASVVGPGTLMTYETLRSIAATALGGPPRSDGEQGRIALVADDPFARRFDAAVNSSPTEFLVDKKSVTELGPTLSARPRWLVVLTTRSYKAPRIVTAATTTSKGVYEAGAFYGDVAVLDRQTGALLCSGPTSATSRGDSSTAKSIDENFVTAINAMAWRSARTLAPALTEGAP